MLKEKAAEAAKVGTEYAEVLSEKAATAAEVGNEYLAQGADIVKEYATYDWIFILLIQIFLYSESMLMKLSNKAKFSQMLPKKH